MSQPGPPARFFFLPWKIKLEPKNHPMEKDNHLPNLHCNGSRLVFQGVKFAFLPCFVVGLGGTCGVELRKLPLRPYPTIL